LNFKTPFKLHFHCTEFFHLPLVATFGGAEQKKIHSHQKVSQIVSQGTEVCMLWRSLVQRSRTESRVLSTEDLSFKTVPRGECVGLDC